MRFANFQVLNVTPTNPQYFSGWDSDDDYVIVGKVRPWDASCHQYILYSDGDIVLAEEVGE